MKHTIKISVNSVSFDATANIVHGDRGRILENVEAALPVELDDVLADSVLSGNDILYLAMKYYAITGKHAYSFGCGHVDVQCKILNPHAWDTDLNGKTFMMRVVDVHSNIHLLDVGAPHAIEAWGQVSDAMTIPIRSTRSQPVPFL